MGESFVAGHDMTRKRDESVVSNYWTLCRTIWPVLCGIRHPLATGRMFDVSSWSELVGGGCARTAAKLAKNLTNPVS